MGVDVDPRVFGGRFQNSIADGFAENLSTDGLEWTSLDDMKHPT